MAEKSEIELRGFTVADLEVRAQGEKGRTLRGYATVFNDEATIHEYGQEFREQIAPGAFREALAGDVVALYNHNRDAVLGRTSSGTLRLNEDAKGLSFEIDLPDTALGRDLAE